MIAVYFNRYKERNYLFFISKCSGDLIVSYMKVYAIFCTIMDYTIFSNVIRFRGNRKYRNRVHVDDIQDALSPSTAIF